MTAVDRQRRELVLRTVEAEPRSVTLPAAFWNAKGRRHLTLAYCRTIHKAQGSTYRGASFTLAGDDTIHLEAVHVALSRGTEANHLYYCGDPPPDEEHIAVELVVPELEGLVAAAERSRAQVMAIDLLHDAPAAPDGPAGRVRDWVSAPMTEAQVATLARHGSVPAREHTWVEASLLIDGATGAPPGRKAAQWLRENGASADEIPAILERAEKVLRSPAHDREAVVERMRERRRAWARRAPASSEAGRRPHEAAVGRPPPGRGLR